MLWVSRTSRCHADGLRNIHRVEVCRSLEQVSLFLHRLSAVCQNIRLILRSRRAIRPCRTSCSTLRFSISGIRGFAKYGVEGFAGGLTWRGICNRVGLRCWNSSCSWLLGRFRRLNHGGGGRIWRRCDWLWRLTEDIRWSGNGLRALQLLSLWRCWRGIAADGAAGLGDCFDVFPSAHGVAQKGRVWRVSWNSTTWAST